MERKIGSPCKSLLLHFIVCLDACTLLLVIFFFCPLAAETASFVYPGFTNSSGICLQGNVSAEETGAIQLYARDRAGSVGLAYYCEPIHIWSATTNELANFTTTFTFGVITDSSSSLGGGITFFLSENPEISPGARGDFLGLVNPSDVLASGVGRFIAIEFDSWHNSWDPPNSTCHVGIDINSLQSVAYVNMLGNQFRLGLQGKARVTYNSISKNLSVSLDYNSTLYYLSTIVDLRDHLPQRVKVGFSLTTDISLDPKHITSWSFVYSNLDVPKEPPPPPSAVTPTNSNCNNTGWSKKKENIILPVVIVVPLLLLIVIGYLSWLLCKKRKDNVGNNRQTALDTTGPSDFHDGGPRYIPYEHLVAATEGFHQSRMLGKGGCGRVYRGFLKDGFLKDLNQEVAVKRIAEYSEHSEKEFKAEVKTISQLRHRNLVKLFGFSHEGHELLLVYEFMPNGSLDHHLFDNANDVLSWPRRRNIVLGLAWVLQYIHEGLDKCIVHRDIKPSNILLDSDFNPKLGDFGLARITHHGSALQSTTMAGTMGYMAPEYFATGKASKEADVYSFGIVALELASGRRAMDPREKGKEALFNWIWELYGNGMIRDAVDKKLQTSFVEHEVERLLMVGLWCAHPYAGRRPVFSQVISALKFDIAVPSLV